jgi:hypothetical protein
MRIFIEKYLDDMRKCTYLCSRKNNVCNIKKLSDMNPIKKTRAELIQEYSSRMRYSFETASPQKWLKRD